MREDACKFLTKLLPRRHSWKTTRVEYDYWRINAWGDRRICRRCLRAEAWKPNRSDVYGWKHVEYGVSALRLSEMATDAEDVNRRRFRASLRRERQDRDRRNRPMVHVNMNSQQPVYHSMFDA